MVEQPVVVVQAEQERADHGLLRGVTEASHDAVGGAGRLDLHHRPLARKVGLVEALGDDAVEGAAAALQPAERGVAVLSRGGKLEARRFGRAVETLERGAALGQWAIGELGAAQRQ